MLFSVEMFMYRFNILSFSKLNMIACNSTSIGQSNQYCHNCHNNVVPVKIDQWCLSASGSASIQQKESVQFSHSVLSNPLQLHGLQRAQLPCPSPTPRACPNSCPLTWWRHPTISSSVVPFSSCFQSFPASGSFQMSYFFTSDGQSIGVSASTSVLPMNTQDWSPLG